LADENEATSKNCGLGSAIVRQESQQREKRGIFHVSRAGPRFFGSLCPGSNPGGVVIKIAARPFSLTAWDGVACNKDATAIAEFNSSGKKPSPSTGP
jgi:hypothetical protein